MEIDVKVNPNSIIVSIEIPLPDVKKINFGNVISLAWSIIKAIKKKKV